MNTFLELSLHDFDPVVSTHRRLDFAHFRFRFVVAAGIKTFLQRALELVCNLAVLITVEDRPIFKLSLGEHLPLNLAINFSSTLFDVEAVRNTTCVRPHQEFAGLVLETLEFLGVLIKLQVPKLLFLNTLFIGLEVVHQVFDLLYFGFCIGVNDLGEILHQAEICTHSISQAR